MGLYTLLCVRDTSSVNQDGDMRQVQRWLPHLVFGCAIDASPRRTVDMRKALRYDLLTQLHQCV